ncbi:MAG: ABC transporter permease [Clostridiales bacterium]|nr:ABC transporter permease [Clostridiales bacterium]
MLLRMIKGALLRQKSKMLLIALTIALGASLSTSMINVMLDVRDKVQEEMKAFGANIVVKPNDSTLLSDMYSIEDEGGTALKQSWLKENELGKIKEIFWTFQIRNFAPFLNGIAELEDGRTVQTVGTWFNHHLSLATGEELDAGVKDLRSWWDISQGEWIDESEPDAQTQVMLGTQLAADLGLKAGDTLTLKGKGTSQTVNVRAIFDSGEDADSQIWMPLDLAQKLSGLEGCVGTVEVSAITEPDNELSLRAARNPGGLSAKEWDQWYCTAYVSAICYQITEVMSNSTASAVRQVAEGEGAILEKTELLMIMITALSLVGVALGISNLVTASVMERAQEIGLLKAIGAKDKAITGVIMAEILITALLGMIVGYFMGLGFAGFIGRRVFGASIDIKPIVIPIVAAAISLVTVAGSLPAIRMILRTDPAVVLHGSKA